MKKILMLSVIMLLLLFQNISGAAVTDDTKDSVRDLISAGIMSCAEGTALIAMLGDLDPDNLCGVRMSCATPKEINDYFLSGNKAVGTVIAFVVSFIIAKEIDRELDYEEVRAEVANTFYSMVDYEDELHRQSVKYKFVCPR